MRLELWLTQLIAAASVGLLRLQEADSDADYRQAAEAVADAMGPYCCDTLVATCELDRPPAVAIRGRGFNADQIPPYD